MKNSIIYSILILLVTFTSCKHDHSEHDHAGHNHDSHDDHASHGHGHDDEHGHEHEEASSTVSLTTAQIKTTGIQFGAFTPIKVNGYVQANGKLDLPPNAYAGIHAKAAGFIRNTKKLIEGNYIKKGSIIAYLEHPDFISLQQEYLEEKATVEYNSLELNRQTSLLAQGAGVEKTVQLTQKNLNIAQSKLSALAKRLSYLGINPKNVTTNKIVQRVPILSTLSGYITAHEIHDGMYVTPNNELVEVANHNHLHLELNIFEKDIAKIKKEQKISYTVPALGGEIYEGDVHVIGKIFDEENKTVLVHGHLGKTTPNFINGLYVSAKIWLNDQTTNALPNDAIQQLNGSSVIYAAIPATSGKVTFTPLQVKAGATNKNYTAVELIDPLPVNHKIITTGAYYVYAQSQAGELAHEH